jgi:protein-tyrosine phosphatase
VDHLYLGSVGAAYNLNVLKSLNISHILTICECLPPKFPEQFTYKVIPLTDEPSTKISNHFKEALEFIRAAISEGKNVLVHCFAGVSRSASTVIAYLMTYHNMEYNTAFSFVKSKRSWINPNYGFQGQLRRYGLHLKEKRLKANENKADN